MGLFNLSRVCSALFLAAAISPALAANPPVNPSNPVGFNTVTTPYSSSTSPPQISHTPPRGVPNVGGGTSYTAPPTRPITPVLSGGGFKAPASGGITITGVKTPPIPATGTSNYPPAVIKNGAKTLLRGNLAGLVLGAGLQQLLGGIGALINNGGQLVMKPPNPTILNPPTSGYYTDITDGTGTHYPSSVAACAASSGCQIVGACRPIANPYNPTAYQGGCSTDGTWGGASGGWKLAGPLNCPADSLADKNYGCIPLDSYIPPSPAQLDDAVDNSYNPDPSDFDNLSPHMFPQSYTQNPIPTVYLPSVTVTDTNANGDTTTTVTTTTIDFTVDNSNPIPDVDTTVTEDKDTFTNGQPSGSSSTSTTTKPNNNPKAPADPATGGGVTVKFPEIPTDCDFMPTVCAFLEWFKEDDLGDDPDLKQIMHDFEPTNTNFSVTGSKTCPAPYSIYIGLVDRTFDLSFEPACTFAGYLYFLVMAGAYIFAAYITLGVARNG